MESVSYDVLTLIALACNCRSVLALSQVSSHINQQCEKLWPTLYERRFGSKNNDSCSAVKRKGTKDDYRRLALTTGTVVIRDEKGARELGIHNVKKFMEPWFGVVYINANDECIFNGEVLARDVVDITGCTPHLRVLTKSSLLTFLPTTPKTVIYRSEQAIQGGVRVIDSNNYALVELDNGRIIGLQHDGWEDVTQEYNILETCRGRKVAFRDKVYFIDGDKVLAIIPVEPTTRSNHSRSLMVTTREGCLVAIDYRLATHNVIERDILPNSLVHCVGGRGAYYVRKTEGEPSSRNARLSL